MEKSRREKAYILIETLVAVLVPVTWISMAFRPGSGSFLSSPGVQSLKYFTMLSNIFAGIASLIALLAYVKNRVKAGDGQVFSRFVFVFRYTATVSVLTTFLTVLVFFLPIYGPGPLYFGANLWLHLIIPVLSVIGFFIMPEERRLSFKASLFPIIPVIAYAAFYCTNLMVNGVGGAYPNTNDWYGFLNWGWTVGWCIFAGILAATWAAALLLRLLFNISRKKEPSDE